IPESTQNTLQVDLNLQDKLHALVDKLHALVDKLHALVAELHALVDELCALVDKLRALVDKLCALMDKLCTLVDKIHISPTSQCFEDPIDPMCSFHMQRKEPIVPWNPVSALVFCQQKELNVASNILKALNLTRRLFDQPAACTI
ncbi:hypothetical protein C0993_006977, partial [Termitomyces sp. T159_Od127]